MSNNQVTVPNRLSEERVQALIAKGIDSSIAAIDLEMVKMKMREEDEMNWSDEQCESGELEYKRYLHLCKQNGRGMVPNKIMDTMWHYHILDTRAYQNDTAKALGHFLHHFPYFGLRGEEDAQNLQNSFERTKQLYEYSFSQSMARDEHQSCWHDCESRCWHACADE